MAKLAILAGLLVAVLAIADAYTTITTVIEENPTRYEGSKMQCLEEMQGMQFKGCEMYLGMGQSRSSPRGNPQEEEYMTQCCEEMSGIMPECRCQVIQEMLNIAQKESRSYQGQEMEEMMHTAKNLPKMCQWKQPTQCQTRAVFL